MAVLITGGSGFVGLNLAEQLLARGERVALFSLTPAPEAALGELSRLPGRLSVLSGDVTHKPSLDAVLAEHAVDRVIHAAAITAGPERDAAEPRRIAEVNFIGTLNMLQAAREHGVRRFVQASTGALFGAAGIGAAQPLDEERDRPVPESLYGITKYAAERACLRLAALWNLDVRVGRLALAFGRWEYASGLRDRLSPPTLVARIARKGGEAVFPPLGATDYIYAPDVARALIALLDAQTPAHRLYHLGTGMPWALPQWCTALAALHPGFRWRESARLEECNVLPLAPATRSAFSNRRLVDDLGFAPQFDVSAAAKDFTAWLAARKENPAWT
jgi:nucleoside-diphosphate-sugar epimerase